MTMAQRGKPLDVTTIRLVQRLARDVSIKGAAREANVARGTVRKYTRPPKPLKFDPPGK